MRPYSVLSAIFPSAAAMMLFLAACGDAGRAPERELVGSSMGTTFTVKLVAAPPELDAAELNQQIETALSGIERAMSTYMPDSDLTRFNDSRSTDWFGTSAELCAAVADARSISKYTEGAFDVTVGPLVNRWGFGPAGPVAEPPGSEEVANVMRHVGYRRLRADCTIPALRKDVPELYVDLSAYAKGYAVDRVAELLDRHKLENYLVEVGGELRVRGSNADGDDWAIAVERPIATGRSVQSVVRLTNRALATSGDYRNYFEHEGTRFSHTIDPHTGAPVTHNAASVTIVAETAAYADAMATALLVMGPVDGIEFAERENIAAYFLLRSGNEIEECMSAEFSAEIER